MNFSAAFDNIDGHHSAVDAKECFVVAAIDFGTAMTGGVFSYQHYPDHVYSIFEGQGQAPEKIPTSVLMDPTNSRPLFFGEEAVIRYHQADPDHPSGILYERFKMQLFTGNKSLAQRPQVILLSIALGGSC
jgi:hypothetical protein